MQCRKMIYKQLVIIIQVLCLCQFGMYFKKLLFPMSFIKIVYIRIYLNFLVIKIYFRHLRMIYLIIIFYII